MKSKLCNKCGITKPHSEFYSNRAKSSGVQSDCIVCFKANRKTVRPSTVFVPFPDNICDIERLKPLCISDVQTRYFISDYGRITTSDGKRLRYSFDDRGYPQVVIYVNKKRVSRRVHRLVAENFLPNLFLYPQVNHKDGNKLNMHCDNLEWCTSKENVAHAWATGLSKSKNRK